MFPLPTILYKVNIIVFRSNVMHNLSDSMHFWIDTEGTRDDGSPIEMKVTASNFTHVECDFRDVYNGKEREGLLSFERPAFFHFRTKSSNESATSEFKLLIFASPIEEGKCRVLIPDFQMNKFPKWLMHVVRNRFFNTDTWLHDAERSARIINGINQQHGPVAVGAARAGRKPVNGLNYISASKSDLGPAAFRKWWSTYGFGDAPPNTFGPASATSLPMHALSRAEQIDPWLHHAMNCASCRRALGQMRRMQKVVTAGSAIGAIMMRRMPPLAIAVVIAGIFAHNSLRKFATTIEGNTDRAEIDDRSVAHQ
jgi:hypothetical protein